MSWSVSADVGVVGLKSDLQEYRALTAEENYDNVTWLRFMDAHEEPKKVTV